MHLHFNFENGIQCGLVIPICLKLFAKMVALQRAMPVLSEVVEDLFA